MVYVVIPYHFDSKASSITRITSRKSTFCLNFPRRSEILSVHIFHDQISSTFALQTKPATMQLMIDSTKQACSKSDCTSLPDLPDHGTTLGPIPRTKLTNTSTESRLIYHSYTPWLEFRTSTCASTWALGLGGKRTKSIITPTSK